MKEETANSIFKDSPIVETKLFIPQSSGRLVNRKHLIKRLNEGFDRKLTLISAPAGFGKTTLVTEWIKNDSIPAAWISLDKEDNDPVQFFRYLIASLKEIKPEIGDAILGILQSSQKPVIKNLLLMLIREISGIKKKCIIVLDDYHSIENNQIHEITEFLIDYLPANINIVITSRIDPPLPVPKLRVRKQLNEFRAADLSFSQIEAEELFNNLLSLGLSDEEIKILENRTEGWAAGLQLAALSIQGHENANEFIQSFAGDLRHIVDYLAEEVLNVQPKHIHDFLLQTSVLNRLSAELCDFIIEDTQSQTILEELERLNLFIIPLDDRRHWFRYHHLFADLLKQKLYQSRNFDSVVLHNRASKWYKDNNMKNEAFNHSIKAKNFEEAANLLELVWPEMDEKYQSSIWLGYIKEIPKELILIRPVLSVAYAWALLDSGELEKGEQKLCDAEKWFEEIDGKISLKKTSEDEIVVSDKKQFKYLPASIANARAYYTQGNGEFTQSIKYAEKVFKIIGEENHAEREKAAAILGIANWGNGNLEAAEKYFADYMIRMQDYGNLVYALMPAYFLSYIMTVRGNLQQAIKMCRQFLEITNEYSDPPILGSADLHLGFSEVSYETGDLKEAKTHLLKSEELSLEASLPDWGERFYFVKARIEILENRYNEAIKSLKVAKRLRSKSPIPVTRPAESLAIRVMIRQGKLDEVENQINKQKMRVSDKINYLNEFEYITFAKYLTAKYQKEKEESDLNDAVMLIDRLLDAAEKGERLQSMVEILIMRAIAYNEQNKTNDALNTLREAFILAEPGNYTAVFLEERNSIAGLTEKLLNHENEIPRAFVNNVLSAFKLKRLVVTEEGLIENLSERELEVLKLIESGFSNKKIMDELFVSLSTVKTHLRNIYAKLNVHSRTEAIVKAKELNFL